MSSTGETSTTEPDSSDAQAALDLSPGHLLRQAQLLLKEAQFLVDQAVVAERIKGTSWEVIGEELDGVSKSAAQKRYGPRVNTWLNEHVPNHGSKPVPVFTLAYKTLEIGWKTAGDIVQAQKLFIDLTKSSASFWGSSKTNPSEVGRHFVASWMATNPDVPAHALRQYSLLVNHDRDRLQSYKRGSEWREESASRQDAPRAPAEEGRSPSLEERVTALERQVEQLLSERDENADLHRASPPVIGM